MGRLVCHLHSIWWSGEGIKCDCHMSQQHLDLMLPHSCYHILFASRFEGKHFVGRQQPFYCTGISRLEKDIRREHWSHYTLGGSKVIVLVSIFTWHQSSCARNCWSTKWASVNGRVRYTCYCRRNKCSRLSGIVLLPCTVAMPASRKLSKCFFKSNNKKVHSMISTSHPLTTTTACHLTKTWNR